MNLVRENSGSLLDGVRTRKMCESIDRIAGAFALRLAVTTLWSVSWSLRLPDGEFLELKIAILGKDRKGKSSGADRNLPSQPHLGASSINSWCESHPRAPFVFHLYKCLSLLSN